MRQNKARSELMGLQYEDLLFEFLYHWKKVA